MNFAIARVETRFLELAIFSSVIAFFFSEITANNLRLEWALQKLSDVFSGKPGNSAAA